MVPDPRDSSGELTELLRSCVECGLCLPYCATWVQTGSEVQSPRGRLLLLGELLKQPHGEAPGAYLEAFDLCIGCRACEAVCPSGVPFSLLEHGQDLAMTQLGSFGGRRTGLPGGSVLMRRLDSVFFLQVLGKLGRAARKILATFWGSDWRIKMAGGPAGTMVRLLGAMPRDPGSNRELERTLAAMCEVKGRPAEIPPGAPSPAGPPRAESGPQVAFFAGCANKGLMPAASLRLLDLLRAAGCQVTTVADQDCCGALATHTGRTGRAAHLRRKNLAAFGPHLTGTTKIVVEAAGCGLEFHEKYGQDFAARTCDAVVLLAGLDLPPLGAVPLKVAYHDPCHARHGQGIIAEPRQLLGRIPGLQLTEPLEPEVCCGSGGAWGLHHQDLSSQLGRRKAADLAATGADLVVTSNPGCLGQIADGLALEAATIPILPLTDLLWYAWRRGSDGP